MTPAKQQLIGSSPLMQQYAAMKEKLPSGTILLFRLGDFYEAFGQEARTVAKALTLTLTKRKEVPNVGIPAYSVGKYTSILTEAGHKVALSDALPIEQPVAPIDTSAAAARPRMRV